MFAVFQLAPEGQRLLDAEARLRAWWERISARPSFVRTRVPPRHESHAIK
jgi:glutathione S-transferase